jgi:predicted anti-sigma-YlaC factor YlaD
MRMPDLAYLLHPVSCERARAWASEALDGELGVRERTLLEAHLAGCRACAAFAGEIAATANELRTAPPAVPAPLAPVAVSHRNPRRQVAALAAAAAAVAAAVFLGSAVGSLTGGGRTTLDQGAGTGFAATQQPYVERSLLALLPRLHQPEGRVIAV